MNIKLSVLLAMASAVTMHQVDAAGSRDDEKEASAPHAVQPATPQTNMIRAAMDGRIKLMKELIQQGISVDVKVLIGKNQYTPLVAAVIRKQLASVEFLLAKGASIYLPLYTGSKEDKFYGCTPIEIAAGCGDDSILPLLLDKLLSDSGEESSRLC